VSADPVRVASIGVGRWSGVLCDAALKGTGLEIVACTARSPEPRAAFARKYGCRAVESVEAVLADRDVEGVLIATPHTVHAEQVIAAARAGKHVFVDKPFTLTAADARRATAACRKAGIVLAVGQQRRRLAAHRTLKRMIDDGAFGTVVQIEGNFSADLGFTFTPAMWRGARAEAPGGAMTNLGIHHVDTYQYLLGPIVSVMALVKRVALTAVDIDDTSAILFEFASGALGYLGTAWVYANRTNTITVHGTEAQGWSEGDGARLFIAKRGQAERAEVRLAQTDPVVEQLAEFARCVRQGGRPEVGGEEGTAAIAVLDAIVESAQTGRVAAVKREASR
jgi:predicted dehydrogenase